MITLPDKELKSTVKKSVLEAVKDYDFRQSVNEIVSDIIKQEIISYFRYGKGYNLICGSVNKALDQAIGHKTVAS